VGGTACFHGIMFNFCCPFRTRIPVQVEGLSKNSTGRWTAVVQNAVTLFLIYVQYLRNGALNHTTDPLVIAGMILPENALVAHLALHC
jgi:hypothetical protein